MLAGQQGRRGQDGRLGPVLHRLEGGPHRHLCLAEADVAADQAVHRPRLFHIGLDVGDRLQLVLGLDEPERPLHLRLPRRVGTERPALDGEAPAVQLHQLRRHLAGRGAGLGPGLLPVGAAHLRQRRGLAPAVGRDGLNLLDGQVEAVRAPVLQDQVVPRGPAHGPRRHALEARHAVLAVDDEAPGLEVVEEPVGGPRPWARPPVRDPAAGDVGLGEHRHLGLGQDEPGGDRRRHHTGARRARRRGQHRRVHTLGGQGGREPPGPCRRGGAQRDRIALADQPGDAGGQAGGVPGHRVEAAHRERGHVGTVGDGRQGGDAGRTLAEEPLEGHVQARESLLFTLLGPPRGRQGLGQRGLLVEQLDAAVADAARLHQHDLAARRQKIGDHAGRVVEERQP